MIPLFPITKGFIPACNECGSVFTPERIPATPEIKSKYKTPVWTFIGLFLITFFIIITSVIGSGESKKNHEETTLLIENPMKGDIYQAVFVKREYILMKVVSFSTDSVYFNLSTHYVNKKSGMKKLMASTAYETDIIEAYSKEELKQFAANNTIFKIVR